MNRIKLNDFNKNFAITFAICLLIAAVSSFLWSRASEDSMYFWLASCNLEVNIGNSNCSVIRSEHLFDGKKVLDTYPIWAKLFFYFPGKLEFEQFSYLNKFIAAFSFSFAFTIIAWISKFKVDSRISLALVFTSLALFGPLRDMFRSGQISWIQLLSLVSFLIFFHKNSFSEKFQRSRYLFAGLCIAISVMKPQALYLLYFYLFIITLRRYQLAAKVLGGLIFCIVVYLIITIESIDYEAALNLAIKRLNPLLHWNQPVLADLLFPHNPYARIICIVITLAFSSIYFLTLKNYYLAIILIVIPISLLTTPYGFSYDFVLLLPALVFLLSKKYFQPYLIIILMLALGINYAFDLVQKSCIVYPIFILVLGLWAYYRSERLEYNLS